MAENFVEKSELFFRIIRQMSKDTRIAAYAAVFGGIYVNILECDGPADTKLLNRTLDMLERFLYEFDFDVLEVDLVNYINSKVLDDLIAHQDQNLFLYCCFKNYEYLIKWMLRKEINRSGYTYRKNLSDELLKVELYDSNFWLLAAEFCLANSNIKLAKVLIDKFKISNIDIRPYARDVDIGVLQYLNDSGICSCYDLLYSVCINKHDNVELFDEICKTNVIESADFMLSLAVQNGNTKIVERILSTFRGKIINIMINGGEYVNLSCIQLLVTNKIRIDLRNGLGLFLNSEILDYMKDSGYDMSASLSVMYKPNINLDAVSWFLENYVNAYEIMLKLAIQGNDLALFILVVTKCGKVLPYPYFEVGCQEFAKWMIENDCHVSIAQCTRYIHKGWMEVVEMMIVRKKISYKQFIEAFYTAKKDIQVKLLKLDRQYFFGVLKME